MTPKAPRVQRYTVAQMERAGTLVGALASAWKSARFYPDGHPNFDAATSDLLRVVTGYLDEETGIELGFVEGEVMLGEQLLTEESIKWTQFLDALTELSVGSLVIRQGVTGDELKSVLRIMAMDPPQLRAQGGLLKVAERNHYEHLSIGSMRTLQRDQGGRFKMPPSARRSYRDSIDLVRTFDGAVAGATKVDPEKLDAAVRAMIDNVLKNQDAMLQLAGMRDHDHYTYQHSANVAALSLAVGAMISRDPRFLSALGVGALLHDIGKLVVGPDIINKDGALDAEEWERMRRHPVDGVEIAATTTGIDRSALVAIAEHHMRFDGQGYPARPKKRGQHLVSRIVAVADAYDAMTSRRSYSDARMPDEAMTLLMDSAGTSLDPVIVRLFVRLMGVYPPRSVVRMDSGEVGIVIKANPDNASRPVVRIVATPSGHVIDGFDVDLAAEPEKHIVACIDPYTINLDIDAFLDS